MRRSLKECVPPITAMEWMHVDTPTDTKHPAIYESDKREFQGFRRRNAFIRIEHPSEFDWEVGLFERFKMPLLRVLVFRFAPGIHARMPIFRGSEMVNLDVVSDAEIGMIVAGMLRKRGMNYEECLTYEAQRTMELNASEAVN
jgi:hypothetical protein